MSKNTVSTKRWAAGLPWRNISCNISRNVGISVIIMTVSGLVACQSPVSSDQLNVPLLSVTGQIQPVDRVGQPAQVGHTVFVQGQVGDRIPIMNGLVYELKDPSGSIWVVSNNTSLASGEQILVKGTVAYEATPEFGTTTGEFYLWEVSQDLL